MIESLEIGQNIMVTKTRGAYADRYIVKGKTDDRYYIICGHGIFTHNLTIEELREWKYVMVDPRPRPFSFLKSLFNKQ